VPEVATRFIALIGIIVASAVAACGNPSRIVPTPTFHVLEQSISQLQDAMASGRVTSRELVEQYLARIEAYDQQGPALNAMISLNNLALNEADALDGERTKMGPRGPLHGIPVVIKDNYDLRGLPTTAGSIALAEWYPPNDAFQVGKLKNAGAIIIGKANMHEFAYGMTTISSLGGQTRNPYDPSRNPGGSSGGTGAAVAANFATVGMGTDTCGSIRMPSFHHALVGLRGTRGLSSRDGIIPLALTQDMGGPLTRNVTDLAIVLDATVGVDPADEVTSLSRGNIPASYTEFLIEGSLSGMRIGVVDWLLTESPEDEAVAVVIRDALGTLAESGVDVVEVELARGPDLAMRYSLVPTEFKVQLADYLRTPGTPVRSLGQILDSGLYHASLEERYRRSIAVGGLEDQEYLDALAQRESLRRRVTQIFDDHRLDAIAYPTLRRTAAKIGETQYGNNCALSAVSGLPAIVVPAGYAANGMPVGLEFLGRAWGEGHLIQIAYSYEQLTHHRYPPATTPSLTASTTVTREWIATGDRSVPAVETEVTARARFVWSPSTRALQYSVNVYGVRDDEVLFMDLHRGQTGKVGPVVVSLPKSQTGRVSGTVILGAEDRDLLEAGDLYFDVHTRDHFTGAVRVQLDGLLFP
jgi:Asp-tRNA(Asn)/Glu-tRNA(Gln) amidotransferase A subunit family amidase